MALVRIPPVLRASVGGEREVEAAGSNIGEVLAPLEANHPATKAQFFGPEATWNPHFNAN